MRGGRCSASFQEGHMSTTAVVLTVNDRQYEAHIDARATLADVLRDSLLLTGTHVGCEEGHCGTCTVLVNGASARSCLMLAVQAVGADVITVEGLAGSDGSLSRLQDAFVRHHALQCGFCT